MDNKLLKELLKEYDGKRLKAVNDSEKRKADLYSKNSELKKIDEQLNSFAISTAKLILNKNDSNLVLELEEKINCLQKQKEKILKDMGKSIDYLQPVYECLLCNDTRIYSRQV